MDTRHDEFTRQAIACLFLLLAPSAASAAQLIGEPVELSSQFHTGDRFMHVQLLGALRLSNSPVDGLAASELSGLAWDEDEQLLYAVSDAGHLVHLRPKFAGDRLVNVELVATHPLLDARRRPLRRYLSDAEGLAAENSQNDVGGDTTLRVSFEGNPRVERYTPEGRLIENIALPPALKNEKDYACRNCQLESVAVTDTLGMIAAPQLPLHSARQDRHSLYGSEGRTWTFPPLMPKHCALVDLTSMGDGQLLALERCYENLFAPIIFALRRLTFEPGSHPHGGELKVEEIAVIDNTEGWLVDNFEGLTRQRGNRYFMVSDDNNSALQSTLLVYFEIRD